MSEQLTSILSSGLNTLGLPVAVDPFIAYLELLDKWNQAYNLTAIRDINDMATRHVIDSLAIMPWVQGRRILDIGTGAGLPGIPLAIANPDKQFVLLDSNGKKTRFLEEVKRQLSLKNVEIVQARSERYHCTQGFDTLTSRAFSNLNQMIQWSQHLLASGGIWLAMKGRYPEEELAQLTHPFTVHTYEVDALSGARCCVIIHQM